jgi:hypothetical protein
MHPLLTPRPNSYSNPKLPAVELALAAVLLGITTPRTAAPPPAASPIIDDGAQVEKAGSGYGFTEGCTADKDGNVFFTDQNHEPRGQILR